MDRNYSFFYQGESDRGVLLIHGLTGTPSELRIVGKGLQKRGFTVYAPTLAGHGKTEEELLKTGRKDWYESVKEAFFQLKTKSKRIYAAGLSMGGILALKLAAHFPEIKAVGIFGITLKYDGWNIPRMRIITPFLPIFVRIPGLKNRSFSETHPFGIKNDRLRERIIGKLSHEQDGVLMQTPWKSLNELFRLNHSVKKQLSNVNCPAIILHAGEDDICSFKSNAVFLKDRLKGPCELHELKNSFHMVTIDSDRERLTELTADFFLKY
ncbi:MAG: alpha/beta fold hydrolase [Candidatus Riflebacteria bacterium]|nr:alpha/beta fold hydrolase [Candidatus Riflebacteria bacterium]